MTPPDRHVPPPNESDLEYQAAERFLESRAGGAGEIRRASPEGNLATVAGLDAARRVERAWQAVGEHAGSPELMLLREQAMARARRANAQRWLRPAGGTRAAWRIAAAFVGIALLLGIAFQLSPFGLSRNIYETGTGEQRVIELDDRSRVALDSRTRLRVGFSADARTVEIEEGQAQFSVAKDPSRPFKVIAGSHTIVALGTVFTVEYVGSEVHVAMLEGRVAITNAVAEGASPEVQPVTELGAGEELRLHKNGEVTVNANANLEAATAWRQGKVIFHAEPLGEAVQRLNRYSKVQLVVDGAELSKLSVSGVFEVGDTRAFAEAVQLYLPVTAEHTDSDRITLRMK